MFKRAAAVVGGAVTFVGLVLVGGANAAVDSTTSQTATSGINDLKSFISSALGLAVISLVVAATAVAIGVNSIRKRRSAAP